MLGEFFLNPVLPAQDGDRARAFYRDVLGLTLMSGPGDDPIFFRAGDGTSVLITEMPDRRPPEYATISFMVTGIEAIVAFLESRNVLFELPDSLSFSGVEGSVAGHVVDYGPVKSAWFRDTEGNILALNEIVTDDGSASS